MLVKEDVAIIMEALVYYAKAVVRERDRKRVWVVYFKVTEGFGVVDRKKKGNKYTKSLLLIAAGLAVIAYMLHRLAAG